MHPSVKACLGEVIVSCQAYEDTPLYGADHMRRMAQCALLGGARAIRACWPQDIRAIRTLGDFPIVGLNKVLVPGKNSRDYIIITPTLEAAAQVVEAGCDILALDCTLRPCRGERELAALLEAVKKAFPHIAVMADCSTLEEGVFAQGTGCVDVVSTTLSGMRAPMDGPDLDLIRRMKETLALPVNGEGRIWEPAQLEQAVDAGADMVTIGTAITRPHLITERFLQHNGACRKRRAQQGKELPA